MRYVFFEIKNFKGIDQMRMDLSNKSRVYTLVGLNESGKTTILEAINLFYGTQDLKFLDVPGYLHETDVHDLIPISKRSNFNESIEINAEIELSDADIKTIKDELLLKYGSKQIDVNNRIKIINRFDFKNSTYQGQHFRDWQIDIKCKKRNSRNTELLKKSDSEWKTVAMMLYNLLPKIAYFPNFLFNFPDKIFLDETREEGNEGKEGKSRGDIKNDFYRKVIEDIMKSLNNDVDINKHIIDRINSTNNYEKRHLECVLLDMGNHITKTIFDQWNKLNQPNTIHREILVVSGIEGTNQRPYLQLRLKENNEVYEISERSLGFRWFFTYILLTQYRGFRNTNGVVFLFDEPASNLHSSAQTKLLESFIQTPENFVVIYTTHSHYLINPEWLESTFVVKNAAFQNDTNTDFVQNKTMVTLHKYREFVAENPSQTTYFQPVLDVLEYIPSQLELVPSVLMLEGKGDFYIFKWMQQSFNIETTLNLLPAGGASSLDVVIQLYIGWSRKFCILLDSDAEGITQKSRYINKFGEFMRDKIFSFEDINVKWKGLGIERIFSPDDLLKIQNEWKPGEKKYKKKYFHRSIQEMVATRKTIDISDVAKLNFQEILTSMSQILERQL